MWTSRREIAETPDLLAELAHKRRRKPEMRRGAMIVVRTWKCPHGYLHRVVANVMPSTTKTDHKRVSVEAEKVCPWCNVSLRREFG